MLPIVDTSARAARRRLTCATRLGLALAFASVACSTTVGPVVDGFDAASLSDNWSSRKLLPGGLEITSSIVRAGSSAAHFTIRQGDQLPAERGSVLERAEIEEAEHLWSVEDLSYRYAFSLYLPREFPLVPTRVVLAQWKQECPIDACVPDNPLIALRYENGVFFITQQSTATRQTLYQSAADVRGQWLDCDFAIRFSRAQGRVLASINGARVLEYEGPTAYPATGGYDNAPRFYFKAGLYRDSVPETMTSYLDEYRKERMD